VRVLPNATRLPSGAHIGRDSVAGWATNKCAAPPVAGTIQMSPPATNNNSLLSGDSEGSDNAARAATLCACTVAAGTAHATAIVTAAQSPNGVPIGVRFDGRGERRLANAM